MHGKNLLSYSGDHYNEDLHQDSYPNLDHSRIWFHLLHTPLCIDTRMLLDLNVYSERFGRIGYHQDTALLLAYNLLFDFLRTLEGTVHICSYPILNKTRSSDRGMAFYVDQPGYWYIGNS